VGCSAREGKLGAEDDSRAVRAVADLEVLLDLSKAGRASDGSRGSPQPSDCQTSLQ